MQLNLSNVEYAYPASTEPTLRGVTATFPQGWTGIVGDNGSGKTTLALIACGMLIPDSGSVSTMPLSQYCAQSPNHPPGNLEDFALSYDDTAVRLRHDLLLDDEWAWRYETLSSGQQKRLQVACALWAKPDVLVMDEPTNHVDAPTREAICIALGSFKGIGLLISHDRELLDMLCSRCLFVSNGSATIRPGGYTQASGQAEIERSSAIRNRENARRERDRIEREAQRRREEASRSASRRSLKDASRKDSDAREKRGRYVISGQDGRAGKLSSRMERRLADSEDKLGTARVEKRYDSNIWIEASPSARKVLLRLEGTIVPLGGGAVLATPPLHIGNSDHIGLVGGNGVGKSTLVRLIAESLSDATRVLYIPQEPNEEQKHAAVDSLRSLDRTERGRVLSVIAQLNSEPERILESSEVSPGEMRKLMLALGIMDKPELVIMDEPTNHLDLGSIEALERVLGSYPGALLLVSHDAGLIRAVTNITWTIRGSIDGFRLVLS